MIRAVEEKPEIEEGKSSSFRAQPEAGGLLYDKWISNRAPVQVGMERALQPGSAYWRVMPAVKAATGGNAGAVKCFMDPG
jgi:hypothetical protein